MLGKVDQIDQTQIYVEIFSQTFALVKQKHSLLSSRIRMTEYALAWTSPTTTRDLYPF